MARLIPAAVARLIPAAAARVAAVVIAVCLVGADCSGTTHHTSSPAAPTTSQPQVWSPPTTFPVAEIARPPLTAPTTILTPRGRPVVVRHIETTDPVVFVTIDDGWAYDPTVLPFLAAHHMAVTAFLIGREAVRTASYWHMLVAQGGVVEDHTETHAMLAGRSLRAQAAEI
jgi:Polysaccharide deacetylase